MNRLLGVSMLVIGLLTTALSTAEAGYCGACRYRCCEPVCAADDSACCGQCSTVMMTTSEVVYEEKQITRYKTVFEDVHEKKTVDAVKYVPKTEYCDIVQTVCEPREAACCQPGSCCQPATCCQPVTCIRKVPYTVLEPVPCKKTIDVVRCVEKRVPYTVTCRVPKVVCKQVPVKVCCPVPCCCAPKCCAE